MSRIDEFNTKQQRIREYLEKHEADGLVISRVDNFAWATCGGLDYVNTTAEAGVASLLYLDDKVVVLTNRIEAGRLADEELYDLPLEHDAIPWQQDAAKHLLDTHVGKKKVLSDTGLGGLPVVEPDFVELQYELTDEEVDRYRGVGAYTGRALQKTCKKIENGMTEQGVAGMVAQNCLDAGVLPTVILVAADDRILKYRHPLPTRKRIKKTVMVVVCGRRRGLIASCTRMVSLGQPNEELLQKHGACVLVDVNFNVNTIPGRRVGDVFKIAMDIYRQTGFEGEWNLHHQGGPTGYRGRYYCATPDSDQVVAPKSAFAWNPSITGTKSEDTLLVLPDHNELITQAPDWPQIEVECDEFSLERPDILVL